MSKITESIWSDMQDRSAGDKIRQEDDVNLLDAQGFVEYLQNIYKNVDTEFYIFKDLNDIITVPIFKTESETWFIKYDCNEEEVYIWALLLNKENKLFAKLNDDYKLSFIRNKFTENVLVEPKTGKSSNKFFIEIINYLLENASVLCKRILVKNDKITESIWSDMQDRSAGDTVRKEDIITTNENLRYKILGLYKEQGEGETLDVSSLTNLIKCDDFSYIFRDFDKVKHIIGLEDWDVSNVKNMEGMFFDCVNLNCNLSKWDVSKVTNMYRMFEDCWNFNSDLSNWDVSNVEDMCSMFDGCKNFNCDLSKWDVSKVTDMYYMFEGCKSFNSDLSKWNVSNVKNMGYMFYNCKSLKQIPSWYYDWEKVS